MGVGPVSGGERPPRTLLEGWLDDEDVEQGLVRVRELLALLEAMEPEGGG